MAKILILIGTFLSVGVWPARAEWVNISHGLPEPAVKHLALDPRDTSRILAASNQNVYLTTDGGASWKRIGGVRGENNQIHGLCLDSTDPRKIYVATEKGLLYSADGGKRWRIVFKGEKAATAVIWSAAVNDQNPSQLWVGTGGGLFLFKMTDESAIKIKELPESAVYSVLAQEGRLMVLTAKGIYESEDSGIHWERTYYDERESLRDEAEEPLGQFSIEALARGPNGANISFERATGRFYTAVKTGILEKKTDDRVWRKAAEAGANVRNVRSVAATGRAHYAATEHGLLRWDGSKKVYESMDAGLVSLKMNEILYREWDDALIAATDAGIFRFSHPDIMMDERSLGAKEFSTVQSFDILAQFNREPSIQEIQSAAVEYAEVRPDKIQNWRSAASRKAWFPALSFDRSLSDDENIDVDRGGTGDPDHFIVGPGERSSDWSVGLNWDLGEVIWNNDQTSIDTRSRLMVELRNDILSEVTHLYFERRRLQVETALSPSRDAAIQIEKELKLEELTARLDALTGGYLSKRLTVQSKRQNV